MSRAEFFLARLSAQPSAVPFLQPVDTELFKASNCPLPLAPCMQQACAQHLMLDFLTQDYLQVVRKPMDLSLVLHTLRSGGYRVPRDLLQDVRLIFDNAKTYNSKRTEVLLSPATSIAHNFCCCL